jgi:3-oxoadipate enol-lactonase
MGEVTTSDGARIHYEVEGREDGPPLLFSNSLGTNLHLWDAQAAEAVRQEFRVIRYDQRGHGKSAAPAGDYTQERLGLDVIDLLDGLKIDNTAWCGLSMGGMVGIWLARRHPRRFTRMALCNTSSHMPTQEFWNVRIRAVKEGGMEAIADAVLERWLTPEFRQREPAEARRVREMIVATDPIGYVGCCAAIRDMDFRDLLSGIAMNALVVIGARDPATTPAQGEFIAGHLPGARKAVLEGAHLSNIECREEFNRIVLGFLAGAAA